MAVERAVVAGFVFWGLFAWALVFSLIWAALGANGSILIVVDRYNEGWLELVALIALYPLLLFAAFHIWKRFE